VLHNLKRSMKRLSQTKTAVVALIADCMISSKAEEKYVQNKALGRTFTT